MPFIMLATLIDMMSIGLIIPVLPALVGSFTGSQADQALWFGAATFAFGFANFFASPVLGALSDRYGRRPVLLIGFCGLAFSFLMQAMATALWVLVAVRAVSGAMQANVSVSNAYVADITPPEERARRFGLLGAMFGLGFILGPAVGGLLGSIDLRLPFFAAGSLALVNFLYGYFVLPESLPPERRRAFSFASANPVASLRGLAQTRGIGRLVAVIACAGLAQFVLYTSWVLYTTFKFGWGPEENGWSLALVGLVMALVQGVLMGRLLRVFSPRRLAVMGLASSMFAFVAWGAATEGWMMFAVIGLNLLSATVSASIQSIISSVADPRSQGGVLGAVGGLNSLASVAAPLIGAPLLQLVSHLPQGDWRIGAPMYFCALLQAAALALAISHFSAEKRKQ